MVSADAPVHWWRCLEGNGQIVHDVGSNPVDIFASIPSLLGYSGPTSDGGSFFDPLSQEVSSLQALPSQASPISVEVVAWPTGVPASNGFALAWDGSTSGYAGLIFTTAQHWAFNVDGASLIEATVRQPQAWYHVVGTWDNVNARLYVNGALQVTGAAAGPLIFANRIGLGAAPPTSAISLQAFIGEGAIYSSALSAARVAAHFAALDQVALAPQFIFAQGGLPSPVGGSPPAELASISDFVSKVYQNAP